MKNFFKKIYKPYMLRPMIYKIFTRFILGLTAALLWNEFVNISSVLNMRMFAFLYLGVFFFICGWVVYLRLDGVRIPKKLRLTLPRRKKPARFYGDMIDHVDEEVVSFDELEEDEKDICCLAADIFCAAVFLILSLI